MRTGESRGANGGRKAEVERLLARIQVLRKLKRLSPPTIGSPHAAPRSSEKGWRGGIEP